MYRSVQIRCSSLQQIPLRVYSPSPYQIILVRSPHSHPCVTGTLKTCLQLYHACRQAQTRTIQLYGDYWRVGNCTLHSQHLNHFLRTPGQVQRHLILLYHLCLQKSNDIYIFCSLQEHFSIYNMLSTTSYSI